MGHPTPFFPDGNFFETASLLPEPTTESEFLAKFQVSPGADPFGLESIGNNNNNEFNLEPTRSNGDNIFATSPKVTLLPEDFQEFTPAFLTFMEAQNSVNLLPTVESDKFLFEGSEFTTRSITPEMFETTKPLPLFEDEISFFNSNLNQSSTESNNWLELITEGESTVPPTMNDQFFDVVPSFEIDAALVTPPPILFEESTVGMDRIAPTPAWARITLNPEGEELTSQAAGFPEVPLGIFGF